jgi:DNA-binding CsgD family transcriptional regulator
MPTYVQFGMALTERERRALALAAQGRTDLQIAADLAVSESVAKRAMHNLRTKLGAHSRAHAVAIGFVKGYLRTEVAAS